jgi:hypothetical protein
MSESVSARASVNEVTSPFPNDWPQFTETQFHIELSLHTGTTHFHLLARYLLALSPHLRSAP